MAEAGRISVSSVQRIWKAKCARSGGPVADSAPAASTPLHGALRRNAEKRLFLNECGRLFRGARNTVQMSDVNPVNRPRTDS